MDLAPLHRQEYVVAAAIADDQLCFMPSMRSARCGSSPAMSVLLSEPSATFSALRDIGRRLDAARHRVAARIDHPDVAGAAQELEFLVTRAQALVAERLRQRIPGAVEDGEPVRCGALKHMVGRGLAAGARHVLDDDRRIAGDVLAQIAGERPREGVDGAAGFEPDDHPQRFAGVVVAVRARTLGKPRRRERTKAAVAAKTGLIRSSRCVSSPSWAHRCAALWAKHRHFHNATDWDSVADTGPASPARSDRRPVNEPE